MGQTDRFDLFNHDLLSIDQIDPVFKKPSRPVSQFIEQINIRPIQKLANSYIYGWNSWRKMIFVEGKYSFLFHFLNLKLKRSFSQDESHIEKNIITIYLRILYSQMSQIFFYFSFVLIIRTYEHMSLIENLHNNYQEILSSKSRSISK